ncbi:MAG: hypothetical protein HYY18_04105 [Planctomycetes bacterium]|nr:hypothetical protein [Planctomycetota bacterium]
MTPGLPRILRVSGLVFALVLGASRAAAQPAWPEAYGERWQRVVDGWLWSPECGADRENLAGGAAEDGVVELSAGEWWFVEARGYESFRAVAPEEGPAPGADALEAYAVTRGTVDIGPRPEHLGAPPRRVGLLGERMPWRVVEGELRAEITPGQDAEWIGIRCRLKRRGEIRFAVDGYERVRSHESWERLERSIRRVRGADWPAPLDPEMLPGHEVGRFLRSQRVLLPWPPAEDSAEERRLRGAAWCISDLLARVPVREHAQVREWDDGKSPHFLDRYGRRWQRAARLESEVHGPCVVRIVARLAWPAAVGDQARQLDVAIRVGDVAARLTGWPAADIEETSRAWDREKLWGGDFGGRWLLASERELRVAVPPGRWRVAIEPAQPTFLLVQELASIEQAEHRSPFRDLQRFDRSSWRSAAAESVALELTGRHREALALLTEFDTAAPPDPLAPFVPSHQHWVLWRRLALALRLDDPPACDAAAVRLVPLLGRLRGDLEAEVRLALLRYALTTRRDGMAAQVAQWIFDDPPAEPEDFTEALAAWCIGRRPLERMRAYPVSAPPRALRRFLKDIEAQSIREVFGTWADLGTVGTTSGGRRWMIPIEPQVDRDVLRGDAYSAWLNVRSLSGAGPWHVSRAEDLKARVLGDGYLQVLPAADWSPPVALDVGLRMTFPKVPGVVRRTELGRIRFRDPHASGLVSFSCREPMDLLARPAGAGQRVYLWRGQNVLFGLAAREDDSIARFDLSPHAIRQSRDTPEGWGFLTELFPLQGPPGSPKSLDFRGENYDRAGLARYRFAAAVTQKESLRDIDMPFSIYVGGAELPGRRLLWIAEARGQTEEPSAESPRVETYSPGPIVGGVLLLAPGPALVRIEAPREARAYASVSELDVAATPPALLLARGAGAARTVPASGLWEGPLGVTGDPAEAAATAAATRAVLDAPEGPERAARLEERARLLYRMGRARATGDFEEAESGYARDSQDHDRVRMALAVLAFRGGDDLELRARVEELVRSGARSRELFLLAAAAALGTDEIGAARVWFAMARSQPEDGSTDLERIVAIAVGEPAPPGEAADALVAVMTDLLRLRRLDPATEVGPALARIAARCEVEALHAASVYLHGRGARFADWATEARLLAPYAGTVDWPPPRGVLAPFGRARDLRSEEVVVTPPLVRLSGRFGAWQAAWMTEGSEMVLDLPGPDLYQLEWRSAHGVEDGVPRRQAAPARLIVEGLPGMAARSVVASEPSENVLCERIPWAHPGAGDAWTALAPAGKSRVRVRLQAGAGFLTVRRVLGPVWMAWDARSGSATPATPFPPPRPQVSWAPDPRLDVVADTVRRLDESRKAAGPAEPLTALGDDLLFCVLSRPDAAAPEWVVRALDLYLKAHSNGLGNPHWQAHHDLARILTRWTTVDLGADLPEFRRVRITQDLPDDPALAVSNALFFPFPDDTTSVLFDSDDVVEWHHRSTPAEAVAVEIVAATDPPSDEPITADVQVDGAAAASGPLETGKRASFPLGESAESLVQVRVAARNPRIRVRARVRLMREVAGAWEPVQPERQGVLYRAPAGRTVFAVRGPTLARLETWDPSDLRATEDPAEWLAEPAPIARTRLQGVTRAGAAEAAFDLPGEVFVRLSVRTVDAPALARAAPPPVPEGSVAAEADAPPGPEYRPEPPPAEREQWRLVEYPGMAEVFTALYVRDIGSRSRAREDAERDEIRTGARLHWKPFEAPLYVRSTAEEIKESGTPAVTHSEVRLHHFFLDRPDLDYRLVADYSGEQLDHWEVSYEFEARLRWRLELDEQWFFFLSGAYDHWWSSLRGETPSEEPYPTVFTTYRAEHRRWLEFEARVRHVPWQNMVVDVHAGTRSNDNLRPDDADRYVYGLEVKVHYESYFAELDVSRVVRVTDNDRDRRSGERTLGFTLAWERWLGRGTWLSAQSSFAWSPDDHSRTATFALVLRFGGRSGEALDHVDPELVRFGNYQASRYPWRH